MTPRSEITGSIAANSFDLCVIGGGASGAGCALDAQLRGLRTLLVDRGDFGCATSTASTKLIHGGLRYLERVVTELDLEQYRVVREALRERSVMMRNAPHLTHSRRLAVPSIGPANALYSAIGVMLYDWLSGDASLAPSRFVGRGKSLKMMPWLSSKRLFGTLHYSDGQFDDARYNLALVQSFASAGGTALNYAAVTGFEKDPRGALKAAVLEDAETGATLRIDAGAFINATGPFSDSVRSLATPGVPPRLKLSKGVHLLLPLPEGCGHDGLLIPDTEDGRVIFAIPWSGRLLVGTTDTEAEAGDEMIVTKEEAAYLLRHLNPHLARPFSPEDVVDAFAGLRPLIQPDRQRATSGIVRDYEIDVDPLSGLVSLLGGKWTVYRAMAERTIDVVEKRLTGRVTSCRTRHYLLHGSDDNIARLRGELLDAYVISPDTLEHLIEKFGSRSRDVLALTREDRSWLGAIVPGLPQIRAELVYCAREEMVVRLEDVLVRRLGLEFLNWNRSVQAAPVAARLLGTELCWSQRREEKEIRSYTERLGRRMRAIGLGAAVSYNRETTQNLH